MFGPPRSSHKRLTVIDSFPSYINCCDNSCVIAALGDTRTISLPFESEAFVNNNNNSDTKIYEYDTNI